MLEKESLTSIYKQNLENDIIKALADIKHLELRKAIDVYYSSKLAGQIADGSCGIENMDAKYLAMDLVENESNLFMEEEERN